MWQYAAFRGPDRSKVFYSNCLRLLYLARIVQELDRKFTVENNKHAFESGQGRVKFDPRLAYCYRPNEQVVSALNRLPSLVAHAFCFLHGEVNT